MRYLLVITLSLSSYLSQGQKLFTMKEAIMRGRGELAPERLSGLSWVKDRSVVYYYADVEDKRALILKEATTTKTDTLRVDLLNAALQVFNGVVNKGVPLPSFEKFPIIHSWKDDHTIRFKQKKYIFLYDLNKKSIRVEHELPEGISNLDIHESTGNLAYTLGQNLWVKRVGYGPLAVTRDSVDGIVNGQAVHRNEFGIHKGIFWANDGDKLAFYRMDESMVTPYPIYDLHAKPAQVSNIRYPFAGAKSHEVTVGVCDIKHASVTYLETGKPVEQYLTNIAWGPKDKHLYIAVLNRDQNFMSFRKYSAKSGVYEATLFTEEHKKYVEPEHPMHWVDKKHFIWQSEMNGFRHLYLYNHKGDFIRQLTNGPWIVTELLGTDRKGRWAYFAATKHSPLDRTLYRVNIRSAEIEPIVEIPGYHSFQASSDFEYFIDSYSSLKVPGISRVVSQSGKEENRLLEADNPLKKYKLGQTEMGTLLAADGKTELHYRMIKPIDFDSTKKYPVVVYVYGGPHLQLVDNRWLGRANLWMHYMAQRGYIMFTIDSRGTDNRGLAFENATFRQLGKVEMADQLKGVNYLLSLSFVDQEKMAVHGWSFGGFMTTSLMTRSPGTFKVGVAGGPVIDWSMYEIMYTERYMDSPEQNPEGYTENNLLNRVEDLEGDLLLIHGSSDDVVLWQHSLLFLEECVKKGVQLDYFVYPGHPHNVRGKDRVHLMQKVTNYIEDKLNN